MSYMDRSIEAEDISVDLAALRAQGLKLVIQIPCYNEEDTLARVLEDLPRAIDGIDALIRLDVPWWTYDAIDKVEAFLSDRPGARVFEWGCGASTVWLVKRADSVVSIDHDAPWVEFVAPRLAERGNTGVELVSRRRPARSRSALSLGQGGICGPDLPRLCRGYRPSRGPFRPNRDRRTRPHRLSRQGDREAGEGRGDRFRQFAPCAIPHGSCRERPSSEGDTRARAFVAAARPDDASAALEADQPSGRIRSRTKSMRPVWRARCSRSAARICTTLA